ncbi:MAG TPA: hypothetical protein EYO33_33185, partial [Phycisphaerales bacterium]|nr:hypothetical protein [Phycisphaerales bacterium]
MQVSMTGEQSGDVADLVNAVVQSYLDEVVDAERQQRLIRLQSLKEAKTLKESEIRTKRTELRNLADALGTSDSGSLTIAQQSALQQLSTTRSELSNVNHELMKAETELQLLQKLQGSEKQAPAGDEEGEHIEENEQDGLEDAAPSSSETLPVVLSRELEAVVQSDSHSVELMAQLGRVESLMKLSRARFSREAAASQIAKYQAEAEQLKNQLDARRDVLYKDFLRQRRMMGNSSGVGVSRQFELESQIALSKQHQERLQDELKQYDAEARRVGVKSVDLEMMRADI